MLSLVTVGYGAMQRELRVISTVLQTGGYVALIQIDQALGLLLQCVGAMLLLPWLIEVRARDIVAQSLIFLAIDAQALWVLVVTGTLPSGQ